MSAAEICTRCNDSISNYMNRTFIHIKSMYEKNNSPQILMKIFFPAYLKFHVSKEFDK